MSMGRLIGVGGPVWLHDDSPLKLLVVRPVKSGQPPPPDSALSRAPHFTDDPPPGPTPSRSGQRGELSWAVGGTLQLDLVIYECCGAVLGGLAAPEACFGQAPETESLREELIEAP